jgi:hypothetical protein
LERKSCQSVSRGYPKEQHQDEWYDDLEEMDVGLKDGGILRWRI